MGASLGQVPGQLWAQAQGVTRVDQSDPAITYTGTWYSNNAAANSDGLTALTNAKGAMAAINFTGTGITWIGVKDPYSGIAWIFLDGVYSTVDTYSSATLYQQPLLSAQNLAPGLHNLVIQVPHIRDANTQGSWIWVNAFDITNGAAVMGGTSVADGRVEETNPALTYSGKWYSQISTVHSGGSAVEADDPAASVSIAFNGTSINWITYRDQWSGIADVYLDGVLKATIDNYLPAAQAQVVAYSATGLASGAHTLTIAVTGTNNPNSASNWVWLDAFQIVGSLAVSGPPTVNAGGVINAASYAPAPNNQVTQGQIISIFGSNLLPSGRADAPGFPLPTQLGSSNATVNACGRNIPLYSVFPGQINAQLPFECPATGTASLIVTVGGQAAASQEINLAPASPGVFTLNSSGTGDGAIMHADNSPVSATSPAKGGEEVALYATGLGATTPMFATGIAVTGTNSTMNPVTATIGGKNASVVYSGLAVGFAGLYQVNVIVPAGLSGSQPVIVAAGAGNLSRAGVTLFVTP
jgi:uncharacterized protein (TIGR03437 family)